MTMKLEVGDIRYSKTRKTAYMIVGVTPQRNGDVRLWLSRKSHGLIRAGSLARRIR